MTITDFVVGQVVDFNHTFYQDDIDLFALLSGDRNPLHMDDAYAQTSGYPGRVVHGMLVASLFSQVIGMHLPGKQALLLTQDIRYHRPVFIGEQVRVWATIRAIHPNISVIHIDMVIQKADGKIAVSGEAKVKVRE